MADVWKDVQLAPGEHVHKRLGPFGLQVSRDGEDSDALVESNVPLEAKNESGNMAPVELALDDRGDSFESKNPIVPVSYSKHLGDGLRFERAGITVRPAVAPPADSAEVSNVADKAFFANVAEDTDMWEAPSDFGSEISYQLRSESSPEHLRLKFDLPDGAELHEAPDGSGQVTVVRGDTPLATISPPAAVDADGAEVPATYSVAGDTLSIDVDHRDGDFLYPIMVDPFIESYDWYGGYCAYDSRFCGGPTQWARSGQGDWQYQYTCVLSSCFGASYGYSSLTGYYGLYIWSNNGQALHTGMWGEWYEDPWRAHIKIPRAEFQASWNLPYVGSVYSGIYDFDNGQYDNSYEEVFPSRAKTSSGWWHTACTNPNCDWDAPVNADRSRATFGERINGPGNPTETNFVMLGRTAIYWWDKYGPTVASDMGTRPWAEHDSVAISGTIASDLGIGLDDVMVRWWNGSKIGHWPAQTPACTGFHNNPCPNSIAFSDLGIGGVINSDWSPQAEGVLPVYIDAHEKIDRKTTGHLVDFRIDRTPPNVPTTTGSLSASALSGSGGWIKDGSYALTASASDAYSGVKTLGFTLTPHDGQSYSNSQTYPGTADCGTGGCPQTRSNASSPFTWNTAGVPEGAYDATITARDALDHARPDTWSVKLDRTLPDAVASGPLAQQGGVVGPDDTVVHVTPSDAGSGVTSVQLVVNNIPQGNPVPMGNCTSACASVDLTWDNSSAADGPQQMSLQINDRAGNTRTQSWTTYLDTEAPEIEPSGGLIEYGGRSLPNGDQSLTITATDDAADGPRFGVDAIKFTVDGTVVSESDQPCPASTHSCPLTATYTTSDAALGPGVHRVGFEISDRGGNDDSDSWYVLVEDADTNTPPVQSSPADSSPVRIDGPVAGGRLGESIAGLGDINGDGIDDYAIGAPGTSPRGRTEAGSVYILYGRASGTVDLAQFSSSDGFRIDGATAGDHAGTALATVGDVNGDGNLDLAIGAPRDGAQALTGPTHGSVYIVFGGTQQNVDLATLDDATTSGDPGFRIDGPPPPALPIPGTLPDRPFGSVIATGTGSLYDEGIQGTRSDDVNDDGLSDIVLGSSDEGNNGRLASGSAYVIFGKTDTAPIDTQQLGSTGYRIDGAAAGDRLGYSVAAIGDANGDDYPDIAAGAPGAIPGGAGGAGAAYVLFGGPSAGAVDTLALGAAGYQVAGSAGDGLGYSLTALDDVNDDDLADFVIGGRNVFVAFGRDDGTSVSAATSDDSTGYRVEGDGTTELTVGETGDVDHDGLPDFAVGAPTATPGGGGWLIFGNDHASTEQLTALAGQRGETWVTDAADGALGATFAAGGRATGHNAADQLIGAPDANRNARPDSGSVYVRPGVERPACVDGYDAPPADDGAIFTCLEGESTLSIDRNADGQPDEVVDNSSASAARSRSPRSNRRYDRGDTYVEGKVLRRGHARGVEWFGQRTGVSYKREIRNGEYVYYEIGRVRMSDRILLTGNIARHKVIRVSVIYHEYPVRPTFYAICQERRRNHQYEDGCNGHDTYVFGRTVNYYSGGNRGIHMVNEDRSMYGPGRMRWRINVSGNFKNGEQIGDVTWSPPPQFRTKKYYCKHSNLSCLFFRAR